MTTQQLPPGASLHLDIITPEIESAILTELNQQPWSDALRRRTQHYGYTYDYTTRALNGEAQQTTPLSGWILRLAEHFRDSDVFGKNPNGTNVIPTQCIVNEYTRNQGINSHTDAAIFGPTIVSVSLGDPTVMIFMRGEKTIPIYLPPRSALILTGDSRYYWKHEIPARVTYELPDGRKITKPANYRRVSLTYRTLA